ncbi:hypothetical protein [Anaeromyxobacter paludicola]|uniref:MxaA protein n=1 Tax=Anaeromyxobacter paludicola TaxID=2918171 RepID=A0ABM7XEN3_9BACT|nr:hypothetical protein [Anaeromyxobacter paludicola]BDG10276.1 hypothetical protein AMPC_33890 [Anaeromyxobacter paludicola]
MTGAALLLLLAAADAEPAARAEADKTEVRLGETFRYELSLRHQPSEGYVLAPLPDLAPFAARSATCRTEPDGPDAAVSRCTLTLAVYALGEHRIPDLALQGGGALGERKVKVPGLAVKTVLVTDPETPPRDLPLEDVSGPVEVRVRSWRLVGWAAGVALAAALAFLGGRAALRAWRRRRAASAPAAPPEPPDAAFARALEALAAAPLDAGLFDRLSTAVRRYLGALSGLPALDLTSAELLEALRARPVPGLDLAALARFAADADLVKFARAAPGAAERDRALAFGRALLAATRAAWVPPGEAPR